MQITLFRYIFPGLKKIGILYSPKYNKHWFKDVVKKKVQLPAGSHIFFNLKKTNEYGLKYRKMAFSTVNRIVE